MPGNQLEVLYPAVPTDDGREAHHALDPRRLGQRRIYRRHLVELALNFGSFFTGDCLRQSSFKIGMFNVYRWFEIVISTHLPTLNQIN